MSFVLAHRRKKFLTSVRSEVRLTFRCERQNGCAGKGYLEDRRPSANVDPYTVARLLIKTTILN